MSILFALGSDEALDNGGLGVMRIAELVGREKSQVSRTLKTLEDCGMLSRDGETLQYRLSWKLLALAARAGNHQLIEAAPPILERLVSRLEETAYLNVLQGNEVLTIATQPSPRFISATGAVGGLTPGYCTSAGRALLLDHTPDQIRALFRNVAFVAHAPRVPRDTEELIERVRRARSDGVAVADEEYEPGLTGIAAPVRDSRDRIVAALNVSGPHFRLQPHLEAAGKEVVASAAELSSRLGAPSLR
jgi:DNA-binding IclR family transcriptional regulator